MCVDLCVVSMSIAQILAKVTVRLFSSVFLFFFVFYSGKEKNIWFVKVIVDDSKRWHTAEQREREKSELFYYSRTQVALVDLTKNEY